MTARLNAQGIPATPRAHDISKQYPAVKANDRISLRVQPGEIHAVLGENGAGKSTLMKIIYGAVHPDEGEIRWNGQPCRSPRPARGARARHQHGLPALQPVRHADRGRERLARPRQDADAGGGDASASRKVAALRPRRRPAAAGAHPVGRRAPARRDRARAADGPEAADPRRADLGADAAGGRRSSSSRCASLPPTAARSSTSATSSTRSARSATTARCCAAARSPARSTRRRRPTPSCRA